MSSNKSLKIPSQSRLVSSRMRSGSAIGGKIKAKKLDQKFDAKAMGFTIARKEIAAYEFLCHQSEARDWMLTVFEKYGIDGVDHSLAKDDLQGFLSNGVYLCHLLNCIKPGAVKRIHKNTSIQIKLVENINFFLAGCVALGVRKEELFGSIDLLENKNFPRIIYCVHALAGAAVKAGFDVPMESKVGELEFSSDEMQVAADALAKVEHQVKKSRKKKKKVNQRMNTLKKKPTAEEMKKWQEEFEEQEKLKAERAAQEAEEAAKAEEEAKAKEEAEQEAGVSSSSTVTIRQRGSTMALDVNPGYRRKLFAQRMMRMNGEEGGSSSSTEGLDDEELELIPVKFTWTGDHNRKVELGFSFSGWQETVPLFRRGTQGEFSTILYLEPGFYEYRFKVDGSDEWVIAQNQPTSSDEEGVLVNCADVSQAELSLSTLNSILSGDVFRWGHVSAKEGLISPELMESLTHKFIKYASSGAAHTIALDKKGNVYTWGNGNFGQLGHGDRLDQLIPRRMEAFANLEVESVEAGFMHSAVLLSNGDLYMFGQNEFGQIGTGSGDVFVNSPVLVESLKGQVVRVTCGFAGTACLTEDGSVYTWGASDNGELGHGNTQEQTVPKRVVGLRFKKLVDLDMGYFHMAAVTDKGELYTWGANEMGQLGIGHNRNAEVPARVAEYAAFRGAQITSVACGAFHTLCTLSTGQVYAFGCTDNGRLGVDGVDATTGTQNTPAIVPELSELGQVRLKAGHYHSLALDSSGQVWAWGAGFGHQLGMGDTEDRWKPGKVDSLEGVYVTNICVGEEHSGVIDESGNMYTFGRGQHSQLGHRDAETKVWPSLVADFQAVRVTQVACGWNHMAILSDNGDVYTVGDNSYGQLGHGNTESLAMPRVVEQLAGLNIAYIAAGADHTVCVTTNGMVYGFGRDKMWLSNGLMVDNTPEDYTQMPLDALKNPNQLIPRLVSEGVLENESVVQVACGSLHTCVLTDTGKLFVVGSNEYGSVGTGSSEDVTVLQQIESIPDVCQVVCGFASTTVLTTDGQVWTWGFDASNAQGDQGEMEKDWTAMKPRLVKELDGIVISTISSGAFHTCAVSEDGQLFSWGKNTNYLLGHSIQDEDLNEYFTARRVMGELEEKKVAYVACGHWHSICITEDGDMYSWGVDDYGQLGLGDVGNVREPTKIGFFEGKEVCQLTCGEQYSIAVVKGE